MSEAITTTDQADPAPIPRRRSRARRAARLIVWLLGIPCLISLLLYLILLVTPIRLPFSGLATRSFLQSFIPPSATLAMGDMSLALERGVWPVIRFSPVDFSDARTGARIDIEAIEVGFSPARALFGQPGTTVTIVGPHIQMVQDLHGPRPGALDIVPGENGAPPMVRVLEGADTFPAAEIGPDGIDFAVGDGPPMRSDNDWLIYNLESSELALADLMQQFSLGRFSRLAVREAQVDMADPVYGLFRQFRNLSFEISQVPGENRTEGNFAAMIGGRTVVGTIGRSIDADGTRRLQVDATNLDFAAFLPFIDDRDALAALRGAGALSIDVTFTPHEGKLIGGEFKVDLTGLDLRVEDDYYPVASSILDIDWDPATGQFQLQEGALQVGNSSARISGTFAMGLDAKYGPTMGIAIEAKDLLLHPDDLPPPDAPFDSVRFTGWSAPLYGAVGIDSLVARKGDATIEASGRLDVLRQGLGLDIDIAGQGASADDLKRLWPYTMARESRDWFVANIPEGRVKSARMAFAFPPGSLEDENQGKPLPPGGIQIEITGENVAVKPTATLSPVLVAGETLLRVDDNVISASGGGGVIPSETGNIAVTDPAIVMDFSNPDQGIYEISGDISAPIPALLALAEQQQPGALETAQLPFDLTTISGAVDVGLVATIAPGNPETGTETRIDYVANGTLIDFASTQPIEGRTIGNGQLSFSVSQDSYQLGGTAEIDGVEADLTVSGTPTTAPVFRIGSTVQVADLAELGFDVSEFLSGEIAFLVEPMPDGAIQLSVDITRAGLNIRDIGITKAAGVAGTLNAVVRFDGDLTHLEDISLAYGAVRIEGKFDYHLTDGLVAADFGTVILSEGDNASVALAPMDGGYSVRVRGTQLDLKPILGRYFSLGEGSGGVETTQFEETIALDVQLDRAVGYYATTAFNLDLDMVLRGGNLSRATLAAQFGEGNAISIATNPAPRGRSLVVAFNDAGTILRLLGIYSQLAGGSGSLVMTTDRDADAETGQLILRNFAIVDEGNVIQVLGNHSDSRDAISANNRLDFSVGQVDFIRYDDRVEVTDAVLSGDTVGGTLRGFIYTGSRQYDISGTYVPLFGINNVFQQLPVLGPLLGGRDGEGLVGVTFAVRGPLNQPQFIVNPLSILAPGFLREFFEFRSRETQAAE